MHFRTLYKARRICPKGFVMGILNIRMKSRKTPKPALAKLNLPDVEEIQRRPPLAPDFLCNSLGGHLIVFPSASSGASA